MVGNLSQIKTRFNASRTDRTISSYIWIPVFYLLQGDIRFIKVSSFPPGSLLKVNIKTTRTGIRKQPDVGKLSTLDHEAKNRNI